ncbi:Peptidoglycan/LPS O-acetylase OafA/YrhL, contains acyltransferase and SGNH-hydrolase domains [Chitinophaga sp. YR627]|uniref:acyltransferase family protein n=1 Tax=Chitinophaga sp. YR627 TaxID=1881041 RepID=UPI0008E6A03C|nr:acyltransferase [Chitinophaga sp. YR627]SFM75978.1 Peptidoglycan/LPS O-acetylase OafA/YrhL, contains acyltransferase and SGNH-hydrolase domains [Chitinophaga sp. YR627]
MQPSSIFNRITSNGKFVPEVDGLRFIAIFAVVIAHIDGFFVDKVEELLHQKDKWLSLFDYMLQGGGIGVSLFFVISGYILGLPFANQYLGDGKKVVLRSYFIRRLTRLEPPYMLCMIGLFFVLVFVLHKYTFNDLLPSLMASLTYTHNLFWDRYTLPLVNGVAWSLEVEVQFYIMAPLLARLFLLPAVKRRSIILLICVLMIVGRSIYQLPCRSILDAIQYFLTGFLLADLKVTNTFLKIKQPWVLAIGIPVLLLVFIFKMLLPNNDPDLLLNMGLFVVIAIFNYLCLFHGFINGFLTNRIIYTIGGMCYSIYLLHTVIISAFGSKFINGFFFDSLYLNLALFNVLQICLIMAISSIYFVLVERPCMDKYWPQKLLAFFRGRSTVSWKTIPSLLRLRK